MLLEQSVSIECEEMFEVRQLADEFSEPKTGFTTIGIKRAERREFGTTFTAKGGKNGSLWRPKPEFLGLLKKPTHIVLGPQGGQQSHELIRL